MSTTKHQYSQYATSEIVLIIRHATLRHGDPKTINISCKPITGRYRRQSALQPPHDWLLNQLRHWFLVLIAINVPNCAYAVTVGSTRRWMYNLDRFFDKSDQSSI